MLSRGQKLYLLSRDKLISAEQAIRADGEHYDCYDRSNLHHRFGLCKIDRC